MIDAQGAPALWQIRCMALCLFFNEIKGTFLVLSGLKKFWQSHLGVFIYCFCPLTMMMVVMPTNKWPVDSEHVGFLFFLIDEDLLKSKSLFGTFQKRHLHKKQIIPEYLHIELGGWWCSLTVCCCSCYHCS